MDKLPKGWENSYVEDVALNIQYGYTGKTIDNGNFRYLRITDIQNNEVNWNQVPFVEIDLNESKKYILKANDIVFARTGATAGKSFLIENIEVESVFASYLIRIIPDLNKIYPKYLYLYFQSPEYWLHILGNVEGAAQPNFNGRKLARICFPLPPLPEQTRIVKKLDSLFERIDKSIALLEENINHTEALIDSSTNGIFDSLAEKYPNVPLLKYVDFIGGSQPPKSKFSYKLKEGYVRLIQIRDYKSDNFIVYIDEKSTTKFCKEDDVMIGRYGPPVFQILRGLNGAYNVALMKAIPNEEKISKDFLFYFLQNSKIQNYIISISQRSAGQSGVNKKALELYEIVVPPLDIQQKTVHIIKELQSKLNKLLPEQQSKVSYLKALKASLLDKAFKGEL